MLSTDLSKENLYSGVKSIIELPQDHIHLNQQKLYTLFSIAFQYMLFISSKESGHYIIRVEDSYLLNKLIKNSKDLSTRRFMQKIALPRKFKYGNAIFHLDFFNFTTWNATSEIPKNRIKGAIIVKGTTKKMMDTPDEIDEEYKVALEAMPKDYHIYSLKEVCPRTITIAFDESYEGLTEHKFSFIKEKPKEDLVKGVKISSDVDLQNLED
ncbi:MAG: hypothetical protein N4A33_10350 [Bacteriovoracaceae bacterium]|jgi:hypothetical protein|nr:hypothetical protein [Bacteriovoracaceae bacterium]